MRRTTKIASTLALLTLAIVTTGATADGAAMRKMCRIQGSAQGLADLRATNLSCADARRVYRASLRAAAANPDEVPTRFRHDGRSWRCRAKNPQREIDGQYVDYIWRCVSGERVVRYRWLAGD